MKFREDGKSTVYAVDTILKFIELSTCFSLDGKVIFRGQTEDWPLIPLIGRKKFPQAIIEDEEKILKRFKRESIPYLNIKPENPWQLLALAQHNGLPTRLLDWTQNPLVALWFAVKDVSTKNQPRIVWVYYYEDEEMCDCPSPFDIDKPCIYFPEHIYPYIQAQSGLFTVHHKAQEKIAAHTFPPLEVKYGDLRLAKIEIASDRESVITFREQLTQLGIHSATMFPGLEGVAKRIRYDYELMDDEQPKSVLGNGMSK